MNNCWSPLLFYHLIKSFPTLQAASIAAHVCSSIVSPIKRPPGLDAPNQCSLSSDLDLPQNRVGFNLQRSSLFSYQSLQIFFVWTTYIRDGVRFRLCSRSLQNYVVNVPRRFSHLLNEAIQANSQLRSIWEFEPAGFSFFFSLTVCLLTQLYDIVLLRHEFPISSSQLAKASFLPVVRAELVYSILPWLLLPLLLLLLLLQLQTMGILVNMFRNCGVLTTAYLKFYSANPFRRDLSRGLNSKIAAINCLHSVGGEYIYNLIYAQPFTCDWL